MDPILSAVFGAVAGGILGYVLGRKIQKDNDKPVLVINENEPHAKEFPHHVHPHDQKETVS